MSTFDEELAALREKAKAFPVRRSDGELYGLLAAMSAMCERAEAEKRIEELRARALEYALLTGRPHFQSDADVFIVVGRLVFEGDKGREAAWRYTAALREARRRNIRSEDLARWLSENGGINALFKTRPVERRSRTTRTLHLTSGVEMPKDREITLTLRDNGAGFYDVVRREERP